jgi:hypothetical protein
MEFILGAMVLAFMVTVGYFFLNLFFGLIIMAICGSIDIIRSIKRYFKNLFGGKNESVD